MKKMFAFAFCIFAAGSTFGQAPAAQPKAAAPQKTTTAPKSATAPKTTQATKVKKDGPAIGGEDVHAFIYAPDSSIIASGYTDATGHYETNAVLPGTYQVKIVYPTDKAILVSGVIIKKGITPINLTMNAPAADTTMAFANFVPPAPETKKAPAAKH
jgi:hypothetical protein